MDDKFIGKVKSNGKIKLKRNRNSNIPNHRWTEAEVLPLLQFLKENPDFEKPSARVYYSRFIESVSSKIQWLVVKSKVRHLKSVYCRAFSWQATAASGVKHEGRTTEEMLNHICPFFDFCHDIWGGNIKMSGDNLAIDCDKTMSDSQTSQSSNTLNGSYLKRKKMQLYEDPDIEELHVKYEEDDDNEDGAVSIVHQIVHSEQEPQLLTGEQILLETSEHDSQVNGDNSLLDPLHNVGNNNNNHVEQQYDSDLHSPTVEENAHSSDDSSESNVTEQVVEKQRSTSKKKANHTTLQDLLLCQMDRQKLNENKLELEKRRFQFEKEKVMRELELREKEILLQRAECAKDERLKILEIESKERIAMKELELKYKEKL